MSSLNRSNKGYIKRKNLSSIGIGVPSRLLLVLENKNPKYLFSLIPTKRSLYSTRNVHKIPLLNTKHNSFKNSLFPSTIIEWNNLDPHLRKSESFSVFKSNILKFIRPTPNSVYNCHNPREIYLSIRLRFGLSHLREHRFKLGFQDTLNPLCSCGLSPIC